jgi:hypothetical protein
MNEGLFIARMLEEIQQYLGISSLRHAAKMERHRGFCSPFAGQRSIKHCRPTMPLLDPRSR